MAACVGYLRATDIGLIEIALGYGKVFPRTACERTEDAGSSKSYYFRHSEALHDGCPANSVPQDSVSKANMMIRLHFIKFCAELLIVVAIIYLLVDYFDPNRAAFAAVTVLLTVGVAALIHRASGLRMLATAVNWRIVIPLATFLCIFGFVEGVRQGLASVPTIFGLVTLLDSINSLISRKIRK